MASVKRNFLFNILLVVSNIVFPVLVFPYIARMLGPQGLGNAHFALQFSKYFVTIASLGIPIYGMREVAKVKNKKKAEVWGSGKVKREFLFSEDCAKAIYLILKSKKYFDLINIGSGKDISIKELAHIMCEISGYAGKVRWDTSIQDGTYQKLLNIDKLKALGWKPEINLIEGISSTYEWFKQHNKNSRLDVQV